MSLFLNSKYICECVAKYSWVAIYILAQVLPLCRKVLLSRQWKSVYCHTWGQLSWLLDWRVVCKSTKMAHHLKFNICLKNFFFYMHFYILRWVKHSYNLTYNPYRPLTFIESDNLFHKCGYNPKSSVGFSVNTPENTPQPAALLEKM